MFLGAGDTPRASFPPLCQTTVWRVDPRKSLTKQLAEQVLAHPVLVGAQRHQHLRGHAIALPDKAKQDVLGAHIILAKSVGFPPRQLQHLFARGVNAMCPGGACWPRPMISSTCCRTVSRLIPSDSSA